MGGKQVSARLGRLFSKLWRYRTDEDLRAELQSHREMAEEDEVGAGAPAQEARRHTRLALGSAQAVVESVRDQELATLLESCWRDFKLGLRGLRKSPVFCITAILTLGIGIGANTAVFTVLYGLLLRSLPVAAPQELVRIGIVNEADPHPPTSLPYRILEQFRQRQQSFVDLSAWTNARVTMKDLEGTIRMHDAELVTGNAFELLGMRAHVGRLIRPSDDVPGGPAEGWPVVLSYGFWRDRYAGDPQIVGRTIPLAGVSWWESKGPGVVTVVGVTPPDFQGIRQGNDPDLFMPMRYMNGPDSPITAMFCVALGRLKPGVPIDESRAEIAIHDKQLLRDFSPSELMNHPDFARIRIKAESARTGLPTFYSRTYSTPLYLAQGLVAAVLLLCCVNVGGLMMSKAYERQREFAVRTAIGAARWRLVRQHLTESFVIALAGAALGTVIAWKGCPLLLEFFRHPNWGHWLVVEPDRTVLFATAASAVLTTILFGILPAWQAGRAKPGVLLNARTEGGRRRTAGRPFVPVQVSLSLVLVVMAGLLSQSLSRIRSEDPGFDVDHVTIQTPPFNMLSLRGDQKLDVYQKMVDRLNQSPDIQSAAVTWYTPMTSFQSTGLFQALGDAPGGEEGVTLAYNHVGAGYFQTMKTEILAGREFEKSERRRDVCIVNEAAAARLFPREQALERFIRNVNPEGAEGDARSGYVREPVMCRVIGLAEDAKFANLRDMPPPTIYFPVTPEAAQGNLVFLMSSGNKEQAVAAYREAIQDIAPSIPIVLFATLREQMDAALGSERVIATLSALFGGLALFLSAIGLYGLLASGVAQRTSEIGVRVALGARRLSILRMILWDALLLIGAGMLLGLMGLFFAIRHVRHMLYEVAAFDPAILAATAGALVIVGLAAGLAPALRAASIQPVVALRSE